MTVPHGARQASLSPAHGLLRNGGSQAACIHQVLGRWHNLRGGGCKLTLTGVRLVHGPPAFVFCEHSVRTSGPRDVRQLVGARLARLVSRIIKRPRRTNLVKGGRSSCGNRRILQGGGVFRTLGDRRCFLPRMLVVVKAALYVGYQSDLAAAQ